MRTNVCRRQHAGLTSFFCRVIRRPHFLTCDHGTISTDHHMQEQTLLHVAHLAHLVFVAFYVLAFDMA